jgi:hypothetical protein
MLDPKNLQLCETQREIHCEQSVSKLQKTHGTEEHLSRTRVLGFRSKALCVGLVVRVTKF